MRPCIVPGLIVVDGPVGVGKTTFINHLSSELIQQGGKVKIIEELIPEDLEKYYNDPTSTAARFQQIFVKILLDQWYSMSKALESGQFDYVICDRYFASCRGFIKYQRFRDFISEEEEEDLMASITLALRACPIFPEFYVFINEVEEVCRNRIMKRGRKGEVEKIEEMGTINDFVRLYNSMPFMGIGPEQKLKKMGKLEKYLASIEDLLRVARGVKVTYLHNVEANGTKGLVMPQGVEAEFSKIVSEGRFHHSLRDQIFRDCLVAIECSKNVDETIVSPAYTDES